MIITKLELTAFGKFSNTVIELKSGLNLIEGYNESGKSTLHSFIEGMFFGFFKPYSKNKQYTDDYEKYLPWSGPDYRGALEYIHDGNAYRLERNFHKSTESVRLYDIKTGKDLTDMLAFDPVQKLPRASQHLGMSSTLFRNTVSIAQMANATDNDLAKEFGDLLINVQSTRDTAVSVQKAVDRLQKSKNEFGTKKQSKSLLGSNSLRLDQLLSEQSAAEKIEAECKEKYLRLRHLEEQKKQLSEKKNDIRQDEERTRIAEMSRRYQRYIQMDKRAEQLQKNFVDQPIITETQFETYQQTLAKYDLTQRNDALLSTKRDLAEKTLLQMRSGEPDRNAAETYSQQEMLQDSALLEKRLNQKEEYAEKQTDKQTSSLSKKYQTLRNREKLFSLSGTAFTALGIASAAFGYFSDSSFYFWAAGLGAVGIVLLVLWGITATKKSELEPYFDRYDTMKIRTTNMLVMCEIDIEQLKQKYRCDSVPQLQSILRQAQAIREQKIESDKMILTQQQSIKNLTDELSRNREEMEQYRALMLQILAQAGVSSPEELKQAILAQRQQNIYKADYEATRQSMEELLRGTTENELKNAFEIAREMGISGSEPAGTITSDLMEETNEELLNITAQIASLRASIKEAETMIRPLAEIEEDILKTQAIVEQCEEEIAAYELAIKTISNISEHIHGDFAETFNRHVSDIVQSVTNGKYSDVRVSNQIEIKVMDRTAGKLADIGALSAGTIDQMYFSVRFAIADLILENQDVPIILDDCFVQYDEIRLKQTLAFISAQSEHHQIILSSCRTDEKEVLLALGIPYHSINL
ncbi:MAG: AAA family ATPase [Anaerofustis sp.]